MEKGMANPLQYSCLENSIDRPWVSQRVGHDWATNTSLGSEAHSFRSSFWLGEEAKWLVQGHREARGRAQDQPLGSMGDDVSLDRTGRVKSHVVGTGRSLGPQLLLPTWIYEGREGRDDGRGSGVNRRESRWQAAGPRHRQRSASSPFWWFQGWEGREGTCNRWKGDQRNLEWAQGARLSENKGEAFSAPRERCLREKSRVRVPPGQADGLWLPSPGQGRSCQFTFLGQLENQTGTTVRVIRGGGGRPSWARQVELKDQKFWGQF